MNPLQLNPFNKDSDWIHIESGYSFVEAIRLLQNFFMHNYFQQISITISYQVLKYQRLTITSDDDEYLIDIYYDVDYDMIYYNNKWRAFMNRNQIKELGWKIKQLMDKEYTRF